MLRQLSGWGEKRERCQPLRSWNSLGLASLSKVLEAFIFSIYIQPVLTQEVIKFGDERKVLPNHTIAGESLACRRHQVRAQSSSAGRIS